jgi:hypothetical protein
MRRRLILHFIGDHPLMTGLILLFGIACGYLGYRVILAIAFVMEF